MNRTKAKQYVDLARKASVSLREACRQLSNSECRPNYRQVASDVRALGSAHEALSFKFHDVAPSTPGAVAMLVSSGMLAASRLGDFADSINEWIIKVTDKRPNKKQLAVLRAVRQGEDPRDGAYGAQWRGINRTIDACVEHGWIRKAGQLFLTPLGEAFAQPEFEDVDSNTKQEVFVHRARENDDGTATLEVAVYWTGSDGKSWEFHGQVQAEAQGTHRAIAEQSLFGANRKEFETKS